MIQKTRWSPDTCGCEVDYQWDDSLPQDQRVHTIAYVVKRCSLHDSMVDKALHFNALMDENPRKNKLITHMVENFPLLTETDAKGHVLLKDGTVNWSYDSNRVLNVSVPSLTTQQKSTLQTALDVKFGSGKILLT